MIATVLMAVVSSAPSPGTVMLDEGRLAFRAVWSESQPLRAGELRVPFASSPPQGSDLRNGKCSSWQHATEPLKRDKTPIDRVELIATWWTVLDDFVMNLGVVWSYRDELTGVDSNGAPFKLSRSELQAYPDLYAKFRQSKISVEAIEVSAHSKLREGRNVDDEKVLMCLEGVQLLFASEGKDPYMAAPVAFLEWKKSLFIGGTQDDDKALRSRWKALISVSGISVRLHGLRVPMDSLASIARDLEKRKKDDKELDQRIDALDPASVRPDAPNQVSNHPALDAPYQDPGGLPFQEGKTNGIKARDGRVLFEISKDDGWSLAALEGTRFFRMRTRKGSVVISAKGEVQKLGTHDAFVHVEAVGGQIVTTQFEQIEEYSGKGCNIGSDFGPYPSRGALLARIAEARARDRFGFCIHGGPNKVFIEVKETYDTSFKLLSRNEGWKSGKWF